MLNSGVQRIKDALASYPWIESVEFLRFDLTQIDLILRDGGSSGR